MDRGGHPPGVTGIRPKDLTTSLGTDTTSLGSVSVLPNRAQPNCVTSNLQRVQAFPRGPGGSKRCSLLLNPLPCHLGSVMVQPGTALNPNVFCVARSSLHRMVPPQEEPIALLSKRFRLVAGSREHILN